MTDGNSEKDGHFSASYGIHDPQETKKHYKSWAASYDAEVGQQNGYAQPRRCAEALAALVDDKGALILDAGCGSGLSGVALRLAGFDNLHGCDFSPEMLALADEKNVYAKLMTADLNAGQSDIADETYDAMTAVGVFSFGHVSPNSCEDLLRITKTGGIFIIALNEKFWDEGTLPAKLNALEDAKRIKILSKDYGDHLPGHNVNGWVIAMRKL